jgi:hypothetical protein
LTLLRWFTEGVRPCKRAIDVRDGQMADRLLIGKNQCLLLRLPDALPELRVVPPFDVVIIGPWQELESSPLGYRMLCRGVDR